MSKGETFCLIVVFLFFASIIIGVMILPIRPYQEWGSCTDLTNVVCLPAYTTINNLDFDGHYPIINYLEKNQAYWIFWHYECVEPGYELKLLHRIETEDHVLIWGQKEGYVLYPSEYFFRWWIR